jgi:hypothetical protein
MHPFSLEKEKTEQVVGGTVIDLTFTPIDPVFPPKDWATTQAVGEEGGFPPIYTDA